MGDIDQASGGVGEVLRKEAMGRGREGLRLEWQPSLNLDLESKATEQKPDSGLGQGGWDRVTPGHGAAQDCPQALQAFSRKIPCQTLPTS